MAVRPAALAPALRLELARPLAGPLLLALLASFAPLALAACCAPPGAAGLGSFWFVNDYAQYEAAVRQGALEPGWLVVDRFTAEPHPPALMFPLYVLLGRTAALLGLAGPAGLAAALRTAEALGRLAFLVALAGFVRAFAGPRLARSAFLLAVFGGGLWLPAALVARALGLEPYAGNGSYETTTFGLLFAPPHVTLGMALSLELARRLGAPTGAAGQAAEGPTASRARLDLLLGGALALLHPFHAPVLLVALGLYRLARGGLPGLAALWPATLGAAPTLLYSALVFSFDPFWSATYGRQNLLPSPPPWALPLEYGLTLPLALVGAGAALSGYPMPPLGRHGVPLSPWPLRPQPGWRAPGAAGDRLRPAIAFLALWAALMLLASYLPVPYQRRFAFGLGPALAVLGAVGLAWLCRWAGPRAAQTLRGGTVALAAVGTIALFGGILGSALADQPLQPYRVDRATARAGDWLAASSGPSDVTLASWETMNYLAGRLPGRVVGGHPVATLDPAGKRAAVERFLAEPAARGELAGRLGARYLLVGARERAACPDDCRPPDGTLVYDQGGVRVYRLGADDRNEPPARPRRATDER